MLSELSRHSQVALWISNSHERERAHLLYLWSLMLQRIWPAVGFAKLDGRLTLREYACSADDASQILPTDSLEVMLSLSLASFA